MFIVSLFKSFFYDNLLMFKGVIMFDKYEKCGLGWGLLVFMVDVDLIFFECLVFW